MFEKFFSYVRDFKTLTWKQRCGFFVAVAAVAAISFAVTTSAREIACGVLDVGCPSPPPPPTGESIAISGLSAVDAESFQEYCADPDVGDPPACSNPEAQALQSGQRFQFNLTAIGLGGEELDLHYELRNLDDGPEGDPIQSCAWWPMNGLVPDTDGNEADSFEGWIPMPKDTSRYELRLIAVRPEHDGKKEIRNESTLEFDWTAGPIVIDEQRSPDPCRGVPSFNEA